MRLFQRGIRFLGILLLGGVGSASAAPLVFQPDWFGNAQFAGFFWASAEGYYADEGLEIEFERFEFGRDFLGAVESGEATFGTSEGYILLQAMAEGADLVAIGAVLQESPAGYIYLQSSGIEEPADMRGKRVGVHAYADGLLPFFVEEAGLPADSVEAVPVRHAIERLLDGTVDLHQGYAIDEMLRLQRMTDEPVDLLLFSELGLPMYAMVIYTSRQFAEAHPEQVQAFLRASRRGWVDAMHAPAKAASIVNGPFADERVDAAMTEAQAEALQPFVLGDGSSDVLGISKSRWTTMHRIFLESGMIQNPVDLETFLWAPVLAP